MKLIFPGVGSAFSLKNYQSNMIIQSASGKKLLVDCGAFAPLSLSEIGVSAKDIDAVYITHLHADHVGGLEWLAFNRFFTPGGERPKLIMVKELMTELWDHSLSGGLDCIEGKCMTLTDYFKCCPIEINTHFLWEELILTPVQSIHVMAGYKIKHSYGLIFSEAWSCANGPVHSDYRVYLTGDTQFAPNQIGCFYQSSSLIIQDCETSPFRSGVHAHYLDLKGLASDVKSKMELWHYQDGTLPDAKADGFRGFLTKGQTLDLTDVAKKVSR